MKITLALLVVTTLAFSCQKALAASAPNLAVNSSLGLSSQRTMASVDDNQQSLKVRSRKQATSLVKKRYKARVLSVASANANGNPGYRAKLLSSDGTVFYVFVDAKTGQVSRS